MKVSTFLPEDFLSDIIDNYTTDAWDCDIRSIYCDLINQHNEYKKEPGFENKTNEEITLSELIKRDMVYLSIVVGGFKPNEILYITESFSSDFNAQIISNNQNQIILNFHTPIIYYINSFFAKYSIISNSEVGAGCLDIHRSIMQSKKFSDPYVIASMYNDAEVLFNKELMNKSLSQAYYGSPYDLCERVEGARRFIVSHELGHILVPMYTNNGDDGIEIFSINLRNRYGRTLGENRIVKWAEELWCDEFAIRTLNQIYMDSYDNKINLHQATNAICGIILFFVLLDLIETGLGTHDDALLFYPPAYVRFEVVRSTIKQLKFYDHPHIKKIVENFFNDTKQVKMNLFSGLGVDPRYGPLSVIWPLELTSFGRKLSNRYFEKIKYEIETYEFYESF